MTRSMIHTELFRSHPITSERVKHTQKNIQELLQGQPQYVVTSSEFSEVKSRLQQVLAKREAGPRNDATPVLRRTAQGPDVAEKPNSNDEQPTLRRQTSGDGI